MKNSKSAQDMWSWNVLKSKSINPRLTLIFPVLAGVLLYSPFLKQGWWTGDDTAILHATIEHGWLAFFYKPEIWRTISATNLTPWINLSYALDWNLFGFNPKGFFIHHIFSFAVTTICCGLLLIEITNTLTTIGTLLLFITSLPALALAEHLWLRHYLEGLAFAALAFFFFIRGLRTQSLFKAFLGAFFYLLSVTAKELYVPLISLVVFYPGSFSKKGNILKVPFLFVALLYIVWRPYMLGISNIFESDMAFSSSLLPKIWDIPIVIAKGLFVQDIFAFCFLIVFAISLFIFVKKKNGFLLFFCFTCIVSILIPVIPVAYRLNSLTIFDLSPLRILTVTIFCLYFFVLNIFCDLNKKVAVLILLGGLIINLWNLFGANALEKGIERHQSYKTMGEFLLKSGPQKVFVLADGSFYLSHFFTELLELSEKIGTKRQNHGARFCTDGCLCKRLLKNKKNEFYTFNGRDVIKIKSWNCNVNEEVTLNATFRYNNGMLAWEFGPFEQGQYCALPMKNGLPESIYCLPKRGKIKVYLNKDAQVILRYRDPSGWIAYSDIVEIKVNAGEN